MIEIPSFHQEFEHEQLEGGLKLDAQSIILCSVTSRSLCTIMICLISEGFLTYLKGKTTCVILSSLLYQLLMCYDCDNNTPAPNSKGQC